MKRIQGLILLIAVLLSFITSCGEPRAEDLMDGIVRGRITPSENISAGADSAIDFSLSLLTMAGEDNGNVILSPISVLSALAMTANGASGETLRQMEHIFGMSASEMNEFMYSYLCYLPEDEKARLSIAASVWFSDSGRFSVSTDFLQRAKDYYGAHAYKAPFDRSTVRALNSWVEENTLGMIDKVIDDIPKGTLMYLVNAVAFDGEWLIVYNEEDVYDSFFTSAEGERQEAEMMRSEEGRYLEGDDYVGFVKSYKGGRFAFAALLPRDGISPRELAGSLTGEGLREALLSPTRANVRAHMPKFGSEFTMDLVDPLSEMGMTDAFSLERADFSAIGESSEGNIYLSQGIHKAVIKVDERGTKAGAVTVFGAADGSSEPQEIKEVRLDRPFLYMIFDTETGIPIFVGILSEL